ncbi:MAG: hypothetical protein K2O13_10750 [Lachnospiraceae bacterium]|nr:hypothetical protein [Lachnospiraceae bacterium]
MKERVYQWAQALCSCAGEGEDFLKDFWEALTQSEGVYREFEYYLEHQTFLCEYKIAGYSVVDIMVWQIDHFKANLDQSKGGNAYTGGGSGDRMLLMAFHTMLKMEQEPEGYAALMQTETGTDYSGKY